MKNSLKTTGSRLARVLNRGPQKKYSIEVHRTKNSTKVVLVLVTQSCLKTKKHKRSTRQSNQHLRQKLFLKIFFSLSNLGSLRFLVYCMKDKI